jgi:hypothetical protein
LGCRLHCFKIHRVNGVAHVLSREFDEFSPYIGASPDSQEDPGLTIFKAGVCPDINVQAVPLQYNEKHPLVMAKIDKLGQVLDNFGDEPDPDQVAEDVRLLAMRAKSFRDVRPEFSNYWQAYNAQMTELQQAQDTVLGVYEFKPLPPQTPNDNHLTVTHKEILEALNDAQTAQEYWQAVLQPYPDPDNPSGKYARGTEEAAFVALMEAVKMHGSSFVRRQNFMPTPLKYLKLASNTTGGNEQNWSVERACVGDVLLVRLEDNAGTRKPWDLALVLDPDTQQDAPRKPGLHVPAGQRGRAKVC